MIDYDALKETTDGGRFERLDALLIGLIAIVASLLVVLQTGTSLDEARGNGQARRLASELTTRLVTSDTMVSYAGINGQRAVLVSLEGNARGLVGLQGGDEAQQLIGQASATAGDRLTAIALAMGATPDATSPLDPYARDVMATTEDQLYAILAEQNAAADAADLASTRSSRAVMGLSVIALAGVMAGLAAVVGPGRAGRALLALGWICAAGAVGLLVVAAGVIAL